MAEQPPDEPLDALRRWEDAGGVWRVLHLGAASVTVGLYTCDGGEEVSRFTSTDPAVVEAVARSGDGLG